MRLIFPGIFSLLALFFAWLYYLRYWKWRDCIEAVESSCVLPDGDNLTGGGMIWGLVSILCAIVALVAWLSARVRR